MIELTCTCGKVFHAPDAMAGKRVWCKNCGAAISIPAVEQENNPVYEIEEIREELARFVNSRTARQPNEDRTGRRLPKAIALGGASASNPGLFRPTWPRYFLCFPHRLLVLIFCLLIAALCLYGNKIGLGLAVGAVGTLQFAIGVFATSRKCISGDLNAGIVISTWPYLVAVRVDLRRRLVKREAIKIFAQPLGRMAGGKAQIGARLATVAVYQRGSDEDAWADVWPQVVNCLTSDPREIRRTMAAIPEREWLALERTVQQLDDLRPGVIRLWPGGKRTREHPIVRALAALALILGIALFGLVLIVAYAHEHRL